MPRTMLLNIVCHGSVGTDDFLPTLLRVWSEYSRSLACVRNVFLYLDRTWVIHAASEDIVPIWDLGLVLFRRHVLDVAVVRSSCIDALLAIIHANRIHRPNATKHPLLGDAVRMLVDVNMYHEVFECALLHDTETFYATDAAQKVNALSPADYLAYAETVIANELAQLQTYFLQSTRPMMVVVLEKQLLLTWLPKVFEEGLDAIFERADPSSIRRVISLSSRIAALDLVRQGLARFIIVNLTNFV